MSNALLSQAWRLSIEPLAKLILIRLADAANDAGECWPSLSTITAETCMGRSTVCKWINWLEASGWLVRTNGRTSTTYRLNLNAAASPPRGRQVSTRETSPPCGPVHHVDPSSPPHGLDLVHHVDPPSPPRGHKPKRNPNKNPKGTQTDGELPLPVDPLPFSSPEFAEAWAEWEKHRREKRQKITPTTRQRQLKALAEMGEARAIVAIQHSVRNGWTGIFEPNLGKGKSPTSYQEKKPEGNGWKGHQELV